MTRIAAGLLVAAGLAIGTAPIAAAEAGEPGSSTSQTGARTPTGPTGLNGNLPGRVAPDTGFDQFRHLPFNPAMPGND